MNDTASQQRQAAQALMAAVESATEVQDAQLADFEQALSQRNEATMLKAREAVWDALYPLFQHVYELADSWNALTYRSADPDR